MANYVDGFVLPIPRDRLDEYQRVVAAVAKIWQQHGALAYQEFIGDDMVMAGTRSFTEVVGAAADEVVMFGWVTFASREARDLANEKVAADPEVAELMASVDCGFDAQRMAYGGFKAFVG